MYVALVLHLTPLVRWLPADLGGRGAFRPHHRHQMSRTALGGRLEGGEARSRARPRRPHSAAPLVPQAAAAQAASIQEDMAARIGMPVGALPSLSRRLSSSKLKVGPAVSAQTHDASASNVRARLATRSPKWPQPPAAAAANESELFAALREAHRYASVLAEATQGPKGVGSLELCVEPTSTSTVRLHLTSAVAGACRC